MGFNKLWWPVLSQVAIHVPMEQHDDALALCMAMGWAGNEWYHDTATLVGEAWDGAEYRPMRTEARMSFNYDMLAGRELEILTYTGASHHDLSGVSGANPHGFISHMSAFAEDAEESARTFIGDADLDGLRIVHRFETFNHTNPHVAGNKRFKEVIVGTRHVLGFDVKFIQRLYTGPWSVPPASAA